MQKTLEKQILNFNLTEEQVLLKQNIQEIAKKNFYEKAREIDKSKSFPKENFNLLAKEGLTGLIIDKKYGGKELDWISFAILIEEISKVCATTALILSVHISLCSMAIQLFGSEHLKEKYLKKLASGEFPGTFCLSEPQCGSDVANICTKAEDKEDHFLLNGTKAWITSGSFSDVYIVFAKTNPDLKQNGISAFVVEKNMDGVSFGKQEDMLGIRASATCTMKLENVKVKKENLLGNINDGFNIAMTLLDRSRIGISAQAIGISQASYDLALSYAKKREAFERKIIDFQAIQFMLVELATEIEAGRLLIYKAANMCNEGLEFSRHVSEAKLFCSELATKASHRAIQISGAYGYTANYDAERFYRDARVTEIYGGTSEIQRIVIAKNIIKETVGAN